MKSFLDIEDLCRYALWSGRRVDQAFYKDMQEQGAFSQALGDGTESFTSGEGETSAEDCPSPHSSIYGQKRHTESREPVAATREAGTRAVKMSEALMWAEPDPPVPSDTSRKVAKEISLDVERVIRSAEE